jgi:sulfatase maturation enzyme AslB (radical SAM superfamily)
MKKAATISFSRAKEWFHEIATREKGRVSTVVIMGGEVFLNYDLLCEIVDYAWKMEHQFGISITTNGTLLQLHTELQIKKIVNRISTLEISYDGTGHDRRIFHSGASSRKTVEHAMKMLRTYGIDFRVSYTVHKDNYKCLLYDMVYILEVFKPKEIKLAFACQELTDIGVDFAKFRTDFLAYAEELYLSYSIPICDLACRKCGKCDKSTFNGNHYLSPTKGEIFQDAVIGNEFNTF